MIDDIEANYPDTANLSENKRAKMINEYEDRLHSQVIFDDKWIALLDCRKLSQGAGTPNEERRETCTHVRDLPSRGPEGDESDEEIEENVPFSSLTSICPQRHGG